MDLHKLGNNVRFGVSDTLVLLYRYLSDVYTLGDLSFAQFLGGYTRGIGKDLAESRILTVSGNGIGELERVLCLQWGGDLEAMAVSPENMRILRLLTGASPGEVEGLFEWAGQRLQEYPNLRSLLESSGLVSFWQQQCELWQSPEIKDRVHLFGGEPFGLPQDEAYDAILLSHAQKLLRTRDAKELLPSLKPGGVLAVLTPATFRPDGSEISVPARFADQEAVKAAKAGMRQAAERLGYDMPDMAPANIHWALSPSDTVHVVTFSLASPLRSMLIGELLIYSLAADLPDTTRFSLLESALDGIAPGAGAGTETLLILLMQKEGAE